MSANKSARSTNWPVQIFIANGIGEYPGPTTNGLFSDSIAQIVEVARMEDPKSGKDEPCLPGIASGPLVAPPAAHEVGAPTIEGLHKDKFPRLQYVEIKEVTLRMLPDEWQAEEDDRDEVEAVLEDVDNSVTFPANEDVAEANAIVVEWFCIANRILPRPTLEKKQWPDPAGRG